MDLLSIRTFVTVKELQSFSKAGEQLLLTQPAVSKRIAGLEQDLGTRLFDRVGKQVLLTEAGRELYPRAKKILLELDDCRRAISNLSETMSGQVSFATSHHIGLHRLSPVLKRFSGRYPDVGLDIRFMNSEQAYGAVIRGEVEFALATLPGESIAHLLATPVWLDPLVIVVGSCHPLVGDKGQCANLVAAETLAAYPAILPGPANHTRELITTAFSQLSLPIQVTLSTNYLETIKMLISVGFGWGVLPLTMLTGSDLCMVQVKDVSLERTLGVLYHHKRTLSNSAQAMLVMLEEEERQTP